MRGNPAWRVWKRATAWFAHEALEDVCQAMDRETRSATPWRYHVWYYAWVVLIPAYMPFAIFFAELVRQTGWPSDELPRSILLYAPPCALGLLCLYCLVRAKTGETKVPHSRGPHV